ncbi:MAG: hypothetical protein ACRD3O_20380 [Terriglobia bacterium]
MKVLRLDSTPRMHYDEICRMAGLRVRSNGAAHMAKGTAPVSQVERCPDRPYSL